MTVIAQDVFTYAMNLMDEVSQDGTFTGYPDYYKNKSWGILTNLHAQLLPANITPLPITGPSSVMQVDDKAAMTILPYGLAAHLLITEDMNRASFFNNTFDELRRTRPVQIIPIVDVLGISPANPAPAWTASTSYTIGNLVTANNNVYQCIVSGTSGSIAPNGTGSSISDGTVAWEYVNY